MSLEKGYCEMDLVFVCLVVPISKSKITLGRAGRDRALVILCPKNGFYNILWEKLYYHYCNYCRQYSYII